MFTITKCLSPHGGRLERWLGADEVERISKNMIPWYGPPIAVSGVPGNIWAHKGGDFGGIIKSGQFMNAVDYAVNSLKKRIQAHGRANRGQLNAGFSSLSDLIAEATTGKRREIAWNKSGTAGTASCTNSLWGASAVPAAGLAASAAPGGRACDSTTVGADFNLDNVSPDTRHFVSGNILSSVAGNTMLMYDRLFDVAKTMNDGTNNESVTGVPTRYQSSTVTDPNYAGGNFLFVETFTVLSAGAHTWGVAAGSNECLYRNQAGTDSQVMPVLTGVNGCIVNKLDHPSFQWFAPLASGDTGIMDLNRIRCSAAIATGAINFVIGHPIAWMPCPIVNFAVSIDGINTSFNLVRIFDGAALSFLEVIKPSTSSTSYTGGATFVHG